MKSISLCMPFILLAFLSCGNSDSGENGANDAEVATFPDITADGLDGLAFDTIGNDKGAEEPDGTYQPFDGTCPAVQSTGGFDDVVGTWDVTDVCIGSVPFAIVESICPGAVVTDATYSEWDGFIWLREDGRYFAHARFATSVEIFMPEQCVATLGGDCDGLTEMLLLIAKQTGAEGDGSCSSVTGGCLCIATGTGETGNLGVAESADEGMNIAYYDLNGEPDGALWAVAPGTGEITVHNTKTGKTFSGKTGTEPNPCEVYCRAYWMGCRDIKVATPYLGLDDCLEKCPSLPVAGSEQATGNSLECRVHQIFTGADPALDALGTYCQNAQFDPTGPCSET